MKKRILSLLLAVCLCVALLPTVALAEGETYTLKVCDQVVSATGNVTHGVDSGTVHYDAENHILTLANATISGAGTQIHATIPTDGTLTIKLVGTNRIIGNADGIVVMSGETNGVPACTLKIIGDGDAATGEDTLDISIQNCGSIISRGICASYANISMEQGAVVTVTGGAVSSTVHSANSYGVYFPQKGKLDVAAGCTLTATGGTAVSSESSATSYGVHMPNTGSMNVNGTLNATGGQAQSNSQGSRANSYGIWSTVELTVGENARVTAKSGSATAVSGSASSYGAYIDHSVTVKTGGTLTATGGNATRSSTYNYVASASSYGLYTDSNPTVDGTLTATGGAASGPDHSAKSYGVWANGAAVTGTLNTDAGTATCTGGTAECYGLYTKQTVTVNPGGALNANQNAAAAQTDDAERCISGDANGQSAQSYGIRIGAVGNSGGENGNQKNLTVDETGTVTAYGGKTTSTGGDAESHGLYVRGYFSTVATINGTVTAVGGAANGTNGAFSRGFTLKGSRYTGDDNLTVGAAGSLTATGGETTALGQGGNPCSSGIAIEAANQFNVSLRGGTLTAQTAAQSDGSGVGVVPTVPVPGNGAEPNTQDVGLIITEMEGKDAAAVVDIQSGTAKFTGRDCGLSVQYGEVKVGFGTTDDVELHAKATGANGTAIIVRSKTASAQPLLTHDSSVLLVKPAGGSISIDNGEWSGSSSKVLDASGKVAAEALFQSGVPQPDDEPQDETQDDTLPGWLTPVIGALKTEPFDDVKPGDWFYDDVRYANEYGLMTGTADNCFSPNAPVTRGMVMTILARCEGIKTNRYSPWYAAGVEWAKSVGISDGTNPEEAITREQLAVMLYRYAQYKGYNTNVLAELAFTDAAEISDYATIGLRWAVGSGLMSGAAGLDAGKLLPQQTATRAQLAAILHRFFG